MLNPFFQYPPQKVRKNQTEMDEELAAQLNAQLAWNPSRRMNIGLWAGNLLIRIGKKLAEQDIDMNTCKENA